MQRPQKTLIASILVLLSRDSQPEIQAAANATIAAVSSKSTAVLGGTTAVAGLLSSPHFWTITIGAIGVFGGMWITWIFKQRELRIKLEYAERRDRREQELHDTQMMRRHNEED